MKRLIPALLFLAACSAGRNYVEDAASTVNEDAFGGKIGYEMAFKDMGRQETGFESATRTILLHPDWIWQPNMFLKGAIAHEMIHIALGTQCPGPEDVDEKDAESPNVYTKHGSKFWIMRREVAERLGIPTCAIPSGRRGGRLDMYWTVKRLEYELAKERQRNWGSFSPPVVLK